MTAVGPGAPPVAAPGERRASWLELFFDLVFVVAIAQLAQALIADHSLAGFATFGGLFLPVFVAWQGFTFYADRFDTGDLPFRLVLLAAMLAILALSVQIPDVALGRSGDGFVVAYVALRLLVITLYVRARTVVPAARPLVDRYAAGYGVSVLLWALSLLVDPPLRHILWGAAVAIDLAMPLVAQRFHALMPVDAAHVPERFGLFTMIVLGESVVAVALGTAASEWRAASAACAALGFAAAASLWWLYFGRGLPEGLASASGSMQRYVRLHIPLLAGLTAVGAGVHLVIEDAAEGDLQPGSAWALAGGAALFLICLAAAQRAAGRPAADAVLKLAASAGLLVCALIAGSLSPVSLAAATAGILVALIGAEQEAKNMRAAR